jgi:hypothetical protein
MLQGRNIRVDLLLAHIMIRACKLAIDDWLAIAAMPSRFRAAACNAFRREARRSALVPVLMPTFVRLHRSTKKEACAKMRTTRFELVLSRPQREVLTN